MEDTSESNKEVYFQMLRAMSCEERLRRVFDLSDFMREVVRSRLRAEFPADTAEQHRTRFAKQVYGIDLSLYTTPQYAPSPSPKAST